MDVSDTGDTNTRRGYLRAARAGAREGNEPVAGDDERERTAKEGRGRRAEERSDEAEEKRKEKRREGEKEDGAKDSTPLVENKHDTAKHIYASPLGGSGSARASSGYSRSSRSLREDVRSARRQHCVQDCHSTVTACLVLGWLRASVSVRVAKVPVAGVANIRAEIGYKLWDSDV